MGLDGLINFAHGDIINYISKNIKAYAIIIQVLHFLELYINMCIMYFKVFF